MVLLWQTSAVVLRSFRVEAAGEEEMAQQLRVLPTQSGGPAVTGLKQVEYSMLSDDPSSKGTRGGKITGVF